MHSHLPLRGHLTITRSRPGSLDTPEVLVDKPNLIVAAGKTFLANALWAASPTPFSHMAGGSGSAAPLSTDTALGAEHIRVALSSASTLVNVATLTAVFGPGIGSGTWEEAGLFNAAVAGTMFSRVTFGVLTKNAPDTYTLTWQITAG